MKRMKASIASLELLIEIEVLSLKMEIGLSMKSRKITFS
jgi:hypothetical protein